MPPEQRPPIFDAYKQTYGKAYVSAYKKEFKKAGLALPTKVKVP